MTTIARAVQTCLVCPSQWDAWTPEGQYLYLRYRFGRGTVEVYPSPNVDEWILSDEAVIAEFDTGEKYGGEIELEEFCQRAGLTISPEAELSTGRGDLWQITITGT